MLNVCRSLEYWRKQVGSITELYVLDSATSTFDRVTPGALSPIVLVFSLRLNRPGQYGKRCIINRTKYRPALHLAFPEPFTLHSKYSAFVLQGPEKVSS